ncbi:hypothetical protein AN639_11125 [Candidatus Epulonipiscium fishelsonii]|uniref:Uncharacterized protein n=1 Tax=Candidatus Epulonipiscium fishelsonii TaxID=77094 RepID=A0ACC8XAC1_9FIRM|nr:hypothetical protein AN396_09105 [Epulopiscium sp. SCG-B11WGA-EpuloA1]ONI43180.1 hypothetical protein AN639_11125 [Epulopiscium sp. SCG-B05WGA-EpuloA1]
MQKLFPLILILLASGCSPKVSDDVKSQTKEIPVDIHFIDVGQGDSIFINYGDFDMLIDAGDNSSGDTVVNYLKEQGVKALDYFVLTHMDADHIGGADEVLEEFKVENIIDSGDTDKTTKTYENYKLMRNAENAAYKEDTSMNIHIDEHLNFKIIETGDSYKDENDNSVVIEMVYMDTKVLFTGDMESAAEKAFMEFAEEVDILKSAHHGSKTSSTEEFLDKVDAEYVVISAGKDNKYGHPHTQTLERYNERDMEIYRTDLDGTILCTIWPDNDITWITEIN